MKRGAQHHCGNKTKVKSVDKDAEKLKPLHTFWWECKMVQLLWKTVWRFSIILKQLTYNPTIPCQGIHSKELKAWSQRDIYKPMVNAAKTWKQSKYPSTSESALKMWYIRIMEYYHNFRKEILTCYNMDEP